MWMIKNEDVMMISMAGVRNNGAAVSMRRMRNRASISLIVVGRDRILRAVRWSGNVARNWKVRWAVRNGISAVICQRMPGAARTDGVVAFRPRKNEAVS